MNMSSWTGYMLCQVTWLSNEASMNWSAKDLSLFEQVRSIQSIFGTLKSPIMRSSEQS